MTYHAEAKFALEAMKQDLEQETGNSRISSTDEHVDEKASTMSDGRPNTMMDPSHSSMANKVERELERLKKKLEQQQRE